MKTATALEQQLERLIEQDYQRLRRYRAIEAAILSKAETDADAFLAHAKELLMLTSIEQRVARAMQSNIRQLRELQAERKVAQEDQPQEKTKPIRNGSVFLNPAVSPAVVTLRSSASAQTGYAANPSPCS